MKMIKKWISSPVVAALIVFSPLPLCVNTALAGPLEKGMEAVELNDFSQAEHWLSQAANAGDIEAQFQLAIIYINGQTKGGYGDLKKGMNELRRAADAGHIIAQIEMSIMFIMGEKYGVSLEEQNKYTRMAADQGDPPSQRRIGDIFKNKQQYDRARSWYEKAVIQGDVNAARSLRALPDIKIPEGFSLYGRTSPQNDNTSVVLTQAQAKKASQDGYIAYQSGQYKKAVALWMSAAKAGNATAQFNLALQYVSGVEVEISQEQAMYWFNKAMQQGYAAAYERVGILHEEGTFFPTSEQEAFHYYKQASDIGDASGAYRAAGLAKAMGRQQQALSFYKLAAERGHVEAQASLGLMYEYGQDGVEVDFEKSMKWYLKSAAQGFPYSVYLVGVNYHRGRGVAKSLSLAEYWFKRGAYNGNGAAMMSLSPTAQKRVKDDLFEAMKEDAQDGEVSAQYKLATAYKNGDDVEKSEDKAEFWLTKAADQDHPQAMVELAKKYDYFRVGGKITKTSRALYLRLAEKKREPKTVVSRARKAYEGGNFSMAMTLAKPYADEGDPYAQDLMGRIYEFGLGVPKSPNLAQSYFNKAAAQGLENTGGAGLAEAQYRLGFIYELNLGQPVEAARWYRKAIERENAHALYSLAVLYTRGYGVAKDDAKAIELFGRSEAAGYDNAAGYKKITQLELQRDQRLQREQQARNQAESDRAAREYKQLQNQRKAAQEREQAAAQTAQVRTYTYPKKKRKKWSFRTMLAETVSQANSNTGYQSYVPPVTSNYQYSNTSSYSSSSSRKSTYSSSSPSTYVNPYTYRYKGAWEIDGPKYYD
jgi:TPR repeat protein